MKIFILNTEGDSDNDYCQYVRKVFHGADNYTLEALREEFNKTIVLPPEPAPKGDEYTIVCGIKHYHTSTVPHDYEMTVWRGKCHNLQSTEAFVQWCIDTKGFREIEFETFN